MAAILRSANWNVNWHVRAHLEDTCSGALRPPRNTNWHPHQHTSFRWTGDLAFDVRAGDRTLVTDGDSTAGLSPVELLGAALGGCMGTDVALILTRGRQPLTSLEIELSADRAVEDPRRFTQVRLHFAVRGAVNPAQLDRAIGLSRDKYCSVWHSLRQDLPLHITTSITE